MKMIRDKMKHSFGETLTETLVALLIIVLAMTMLAGSIVSASKVNEKTGNMNTEFATEGSTKKDATVTINGTDVTVDLYTTANDYSFYITK